MLQGETTKFTQCMYIYSIMHLLLIYIHLCEFISTCSLNTIFHANFLIQIKFSKSCIGMYITMLLHQNYMTSFFFFPFLLNYITFNLYVTSHTVYKMLGRDFPIGYLKKKTKQSRRVQILIFLSATN